MDYRDPLLHRSASSRIAPEEEVLLSNETRRQSPGDPFEPPATAPEYEAVAAFGPGRRYWTMAGTALISGGRLQLVTPEDEQGSARLVVSEPVDEVEVVAKPVWSFGTGLYLRIGDETFTLEPESIYGHGATPGRIRAARRRVREFEQALAAAQADAGPA